LAMPCVVASVVDVSALRTALEADPQMQITINLETLRVSTTAGHDIAVTMPESARDALTAGRWDPIQELLDNNERIQERACVLGYVTQ